MIGCVRNNKFLFMNKLQCMVMLIHCLYLVCTQVKGTFYIACWHCCGIVDLQMGSTVEVVLLHTSVMQRDILSLCMSWILLFNWILDILLIQTVPRFWADLLQKGVLNCKDYDIIQSLSIVYQENMNGLIIFL